MKKSPSDITRFAPVAGFLAVTVLMFWGFFRSGYVGQSDWIPSYDWAENLRRFGWTLDYFIHGGVFNLLLPMYPIWLFFGLLEAVIGAGMANRLYVVISSTLGFYTMYLLVRRYTSRRSSAFFAGLFYGVNPWVTSRVCSSHYAFLFGNGLLPLFIYFYLEALEQIDSKGWSGLEWKPVILSALVFALIAAVVPIHSLILCGVASVVVFIVKVGTIFLEKSEKGLGRFFSLVKANFLIFGLGVAYCFYWFLPFMGLFFSVGGASSDGVFLYWLYRHITPLNVLRLMAYWWTPFSRDIYALSSPFLQSLWWVISLLPLLLVVFFAVFVKPKRSVHWLFMSLLCVGFVLNMGSSLLGDFFNFFTFFGFYRDPDKFGVLVAFSYAFLIGSAVDRLLAGFEGSRMADENNLVWRGGLMIVLIASHFFVNFPAFTGSFQEHLSPLPMPQSYDDVNDWLKVVGGDFRVLWVPFDVYMSFNWSGRQIGDPAQFFSGKPTMNPVLDPSREVTPGTSQALNHVNRLLLTNQAGNLGKVLGLMNVKYVVVRTDVLKPVPGEMFVRVLNGLDDFVLSLVDGPLHVFENLAYLQKFRVARRTWHIVGGVENFDRLGYVLPSFEGNSIKYLDGVDEPLKESLDLSQGIIFSYLNPDEAGIALAPQNYFYDAYAFAGSVNPSEGWVPAEVSPFFSGLVLNRGFALVQESNLEFEIPINLGDSAPYIFYVRCLGEDGLMTVTLDNGVRWIRNTPSRLTWVPLGVLNARGGNHTLKIASGSVPNGLMVDEVFVMPLDDFNELKQSFYELMGDYPFFLFGEAEDFFSEGAFEEVSAGGFSDGYGVEIEDGAVDAESLTLIVPKEGLFILQVRGRSPQSSEVRFQFLSDTGSGASGSISLGSRLGWWRSNYISLEEGAYRVSMESASAYIDALLLHPAESSDLLNPEDADVSIRLVDENPVFKRLEVEGAAPFTVVFSGSYSELWKANVDGTPREVEANDVFGMEVLVTDKSIEREVEFTYTLQRYGWLGAAVSFTALLLTVLVVFLRRIGRIQQLGQILKRDRNL